jgi:competence protein ComEC
MKCGSVIDRVFQEQYSGIIKALVTGDTSSVDDNTREMYSDAGIYHILAVSGMHLTILAELFSRLLRKMGIGKSADIITLIILGAYIIFVGSGVAANRAFLMFCINSLGRFLVRRRDLATTTSVAAIILLVFSPMYLFNEGFQYTFAAMYGFAASEPAFLRLRRFIERRFPKSERFLNTAFAKGLFSSIAAALALYPLIGFHICKITPVGIIVSTVVSPTVAATIILSFISVFAGMIDITLGQIVSGGASFLLDLYRFICEKALELPFAVIRTGRIPAVSVGAIYLGIILLLFYNSKNRIQRAKMFAGVAVCISVCFMFPFVFYFIKYSDETIVTFLDVGQGDCSVISKGNTTVVIDCGGSYFSGNVGEQILIPYLDIIGENSIDALFLTHMDNDHISGAESLLKKGKVKTLYVAWQEETPALAKLEFCAILAGTEVKYISAGDSFSLKSGGLDIKCLFPFAESFGETNEMSLVLIVESQKKKFLFTGDIGAEQEAEILRYGENVDCDVLKVAHHGSDFSSSPEFIEACSPNISVISVSKNNSYGHPSPRVCDLLAEFGQVFSTAEQGYLTLH